MNRQALILCLVTANTITSAGSMGAALLNETKKVVTLNIGPSWYEAGKTQTFLLQPDVKKAYDANKENHTFGSAEFFYDWQKSLNTNFSGQIGAALQALVMSLLIGVKVTFLNPLDKP